MQGKGRDDLIIEIMIKAEDISLKKNGYYSGAVRKLAEYIKKSFNNLRLLIRKYGENVEVVDP